MAESIATQATVIPANLTTLYEQLKALLLPDAQTIDYTPKTRAELKADIQAALMPNLQESIQRRQLTTKRSNASADADAAARGVGASTWGADVKNRNATSEAQDIAAMRGSYNSTLASNLSNMLSTQDARKLEADQANQAAKSNASSNALQIAMDNYGEWLPAAEYTEPSEGYDDGGPEEKKDLSGLMAAIQSKLTDVTSAAKTKVTDPYKYTRSYAYGTPRKTFPKGKITSSAGAGTKTK